MKNKRKTPIMGWASWNCFRVKISEDELKRQADALVKTGLKDAGYTYFNMDDGFFGGRNEEGDILFNKEKFPNGIKVIADYAHLLGLKAGVYSDAGGNSCGFYYGDEGSNGINVGLYGHEEKDLKLYLEEYGFDFIKVDWCGGLKLGISEKEQYTKIGRIIDDIRTRTGRDIIYNICRWEFPGEWAVDVADSWRTGADISPDFKSVLYQIDNIKPLAKYAGPGHVNDPDMMQIGNGMTYEEDKTHFTMWCMMSTPLMVGCDLTKITDETLEILKNREMIAVNQDVGCMQAVVAREIWEENELVGEIWVKDLGKVNSGRKAVAILNRSNHELKATLNIKEIGFSESATYIRDLWRHEYGAPCDAMDLTLAPHGVEAFVIEGTPNTLKACETSSEKKVEKHRISQMEANLMIREGAILIDVRTEDEYNKNHLEGAINLPHTEICATVENVIPDKEKILILYCSTGKRSLQAEKLFGYLGYKNVYVLNL